MLKIKCMEEFDGPDSQLLISGDAEAFLRTSRILSDKEYAYLNDPTFVKYYDTGIIPLNLLRINKKECAELAEIFYNISSQGSCHYYYDIETLDDIELKISHKEYPDDIFEEEPR
jgi:hypothetical protein